MNATLIVSRNNMHLTKITVRTAKEQDCKPHVLVVDNLSTDGTREWLRTKDVGWMLCAEQVSLAACWNNGLKSLFAMGADRVLVCNNDISMRPDTYSMLASLTVPFVSCVSVNDPHQLGYAGDRTKDYLISSVRAHPDFSCFMIHRSVPSLVGWFDESYYPAYCEDNDYHVRMHRKGIVALCVDLPFLHLGAQTVKTASEGEQARIKRGADENRARFKAKYGCLPGTPEYSKLFDRDSFGSEM